MKKFDAAFRAATDNKYPYLRFVRAEFSASGNNLIVYFIASAEAIDGGVLNDGVKTEIVQALVPLIDERDITFSVKYVKVSADVETVKSKFLQAVVKYVPVTSDTFDEDSIAVSVNDYLINIVVTVPRAVFSLLSPDGVREKIVEDLYGNFVENISFEVVEKYISAEEKQKIIQNSIETINNSGVTSNIKVDVNGNVKDETKPLLADEFDNLNDAIVMYRQSRQIKAAPVTTVVGKAYMNVMPMYISDVCDTFESATLCGTVTGFQRKEYKNKNFGAEPDKPNARFKKNTEDETLPMYSFTLDDTTGKMAVVYFGRSMKNDVFGTMVDEGTSIVVSGKISARNGSRQIIVDKLWTADIDFDTVVTDMPSKKESKKYHTVIPEKFIEEKQYDVDDVLGQTKETPEFLRGKTFVVFDLETTGLDVTKCSIVQLGAYKIVDGKIVEYFGTLVNPDCHIPEGSTAIHGITDADVVSSPEIADVIPDFYKFTRGATLVGHNLFGYDLPILSRVAKDNGYVFDNSALDTYIIVKSQYSLPSYNLEKLAKHFDFNLTHAHNADFDAIATARLFIMLAERL